MQITFQCPSKWNGHSSPWHHYVWGGNRPERRRDITKCTRPAAVNQKARPSERSRAIFMWLLVLTMFRYCRMSGVFSSRIALRNLRPKEHSPCNWFSVYNNMKNHTLCIIRRPVSLTLRYLATGEVFGIRRVLIWDGAARRTRSTPPITLRTAQTNLYT